LLKSEEDEDEDEEDVRLYEPACIGASVPSFPLGANGCQMSCPKCVYMHKQTKKGAAGPKTLRVAMQNAMMMVVVVVVVEKKATS
jgi:hypothetical protein